MVFLIMAGSALAQTRGGTAPEAIGMAQKVAGSDWKIAFVSNTGVTQRVTLAENAVEALMKADGTAGQWVIEMIKDVPKPISEGGRTGFGYPSLIIAVYRGQATKLPESQLAVPKKIIPLPIECIRKLEPSRQAAVKSIKAKWDAMSLISDNDGCSWRFRMYDTKTQDVVGKVRFDGTKELPW